MILLLAVYIVPVIYEEELEDIAQEEINKKVNALVTFDHATLSMLKDFPHLTLSLHGLVIKGKNEFKQDTLTSVKELHMDLDLWSLISEGEKKVKGIDLHKASINMLVLENGKANYNIFKDDTIASDTSASSFDIKLEKIKITEGTICYKDLSSKIHLNMININYSGEGDFTEKNFDLKTTANIENFTLDHGDIRYLYQKNVAVDMLLGMNMKDYKFIFKKNDIKINHFQFDVEGYFSLLDDGYDMDIKFATKETAFKNIVSLLPGMFMNDLKQIQTNGDMAFAGFVKGIYSDSLGSFPKFRADVKVKNGLFKVDTLSTSAHDIQMDLLIDNQTGILDSTIIDLKNFEMIIGDNPVHGKFKLVGFNNYTIDTDIEAHIHLQDIEDVYHIPKFDLKGNLDIQLQANGNFVRGEENNSKPVKIPVFKVNMKLDSGFVKYENVLEAFKKIHFHFMAENKDGNINNTLFHLQDIDMMMGESIIHGMAWVQGYDNFNIHTDMEAHVDLSEIEKSYPVEGWEMKGNADLNLHSKGIYNSSEKKFPLVDIKVNLANGFLKSHSYPEPLENINMIAGVINMTGNLNDTKLNINKLTYTMSNEPFEVNGKIEDFDNYKYDLNVKGVIDLEKLTKIYPVEDFSLKGIITSDLKMRGTMSDIRNGDYEKTRSEGKIEIKNLHISGKELANPVSVKEGLLVLSPDKITLEKFIGSLGKETNFNVTGDLTNYMSLAVPVRKKRLTGNLLILCDTLYADKWISDDANINTPDPDSSLIVSGLWQVPDNMDFFLDCEIDYVKYQDMHISKFDGEIKIVDGVLTFHETGFNTLNAAFHLTGMYDSRNINRPIFNCNVEIKDLDIHRAYTEIRLVRDLAPAAGDTYGLFSMKYTLAGELDNTMYPKMETLTGEGAIHIADAKINGMKMLDEVGKKAKKKEVKDAHLNDVVITSEIKDNKLFVKPFCMKASGMNMEIEGVSELNGNIAFLVSLELFMEKIKIPFHVTGTYDNPKVSPGKGRT